MGAATIPGAGASRHEMILKVVKYDDPILHTKTPLVQEFNGQLHRTIEDMFETMYASNGVGLAAVQVGLPIRLFVMDCSGGKDPKQKIAVINPVIVETSGEQVGDEGCLSFPGLYERVSRANQVQLEAQDAEGKTFRMEGVELTARCILHESDHLDGITFLERMSIVKRSIVERKIKKRIKLGEW